MPRYEVTITEFLGYGSHTEVTTEVEAPNRDEALKQLGPIPPYCTGRNIVLKEVK